MMEPEKDPPPLDQVRRLPPAQSDGGAVCEAASGLGVVQTHPRVEGEGAGGGDVADLRYGDMLWGGGGGRGGEGRGGDKQ